MNNPLGLSSCFFHGHTPEAWCAVFDAGITEAELSVNSKFAENPAVYLEEAEHQYAAIRAANINVSSFHLPFGKTVDISGPGEEIAVRAVDTLKGIIDWIGAKSIPLMVLHASYEPIKSEERKERFERAQHSIAVLGDYGRTKGITLAIEVLPRSCIGNCADEILLLTDHGKTAKICFDVNHLLRETHREFVQKAGPYIVTTHLSDYDGTDEKHWIPGEGIIDWKELVWFLENAGFAGRYLFEMEGAAKSSPRLQRNFTPKELVDSFRKAASPDRQPSI